MNTVKAGSVLSVMLCSFHPPTLSPVSGNASKQNEHFHWLPSLGCAQQSFIVPTRRSSPVKATRAGICDDRASTTKGGFGLLFFAPARSYNQRQKNERFSCGCGPRPHPPIISAVFAKKPVAKSSPSCDRSQQLFLRVFNAGWVYPRVKE